MGPKVDKMMWW